MESTSRNQAANPLVALSDALASVVERVGQSTLAVHGRSRHALASGVVWNRGVMVTAAHVFRRTPAAVSVRAAGDKQLDATLVGIDSSTDIAVFRLPDDVAAAEIGDASAVKAGHLALAIGRSADGDVTASYGLVNRTAGAWQTWLGGQVDRLIRLDGGLYDGLSGGPVADAAGSVIGMATSALSRSYGIVVPASTVSRVVDALLTQGRVARAFIGIGAQPVEVAGTEPGVGLLVTSLARGGPADQAGILVGDIVVEVAGRPVATLHELRSALAQRIGERVRVALLRGGAPAEASVTVGEWPSERRAC
ncbi:S1C family serine protease [Piscinibacter sp.]|jgi:serine protease Do|uniref:S1C family serine protease n=1 Tax=Piscinibacter sp. TaxID=1903157 RepID=UPI00355A36B8